MTQCGGLASVARALRLSAAASVGFLLPLSSVRAAFVEPGGGVRPLGMAGAFVAVSDDSHAVFYNPAGAAFSPSHQLSIGHSRLFTGLEDVSLSESSLSFVSDANGKKLAMGLGWTGLHSSEYGEDIASLSFAVPLTKLFGGVPVSAGATASLLRTRFDLDGRTQSDPVFSDGARSSAFGIDAGVLAKPFRGSLSGFRAGVAVRRLNEPNIGLFEDDRVRRVFAVGSAYEYKGGLLAFDAEFRGGKEVLRLGFEKSFMRESTPFRRTNIDEMGRATSFDLWNRWLAFRGGINSNGGTAGASYGFAFGPNLGATVDYAFSLPFFIEETAGTHRLAVSFLF